MQETLQWIASQREAFCALIERWGNIDSSQNSEKIFSVLREDFSVLKGTDSSNSSLLLFEIRKNAPLQVILSGHADTVLTPLDHPIRRENTLLWGAGVLDMKGGLAILLKAVEAFEKSGSPSRVGFKIAINGDEEKGSVHSTPLLEKVAQNASFALVFEPSFPDGAFVSKRKGSATYRIESHGKAAHVGRDPEKGKNAIYPLAHFLTEVEDPAIHVGTIAGGVAPNCVPDFATCQLNIRSFENLDAFQEKIEKAALKYHLEATLLSKRVPKPFDAKTEKLFKVAKECGQKIGLDLQWRPSGGVCDGNTFAAKGIATLDTLGAVGDGMHTRSEYLVIDSLIQRAQLTFLLLSYLENHEL